MPRRSKSSQKDVVECISSDGESDAGSSSGASSSETDPKTGSKKKNWEVAKILKHEREEEFDHVKQRTTWVMKYLVKWKGYGSDDDSWEPEDNLDNCSRLIRCYWNEWNKLHPNRKSRKKRERNDRRKKSQNGKHASQRRHGSYSDSVSPSDSSRRASRQRDSDFINDGESMEPNPDEEFVVDDDDSVSTHTSDDKYANLSRAEERAKRITKDRGIGDRPQKSIKRYQRNLKVLEEVMEKRRARESRREHEAERTTPPSANPAIYGQSTRSRPYLQNGKNPREKSKSEPGKCGPVADVSSEDSEDGEPSRNRSHFLERSRKMSEKGKSGSGKRRKVSRWSCGGDDPQPFRESSRSRSSFQRGSSRHRCGKNLNRPEEATFVSCDDEAGNPARARGPSSKKTKRNCVSRKTFPPRTTFPDKSTEAVITLSGDGTEEELIQKCKAVDLSAPVKRKRITYLGSSSDSDVPVELPQQVFTPPHRENISRQSPEIEERPVTIRIQDPKIPQHLAPDAMLTKISLCECPLPGRNYFIVVTGEDQPRIINESELRRTHVDVLLRFYEKMLADPPEEFALLQLL